MFKINMRTPISYYGGKQRMLRHILPLIPTHNKYIEPFTGGAAVFFGKHPVKLEILNDKNGEVINFYQCCKNNMPALKKRIASVLHSRSIHRQAVAIYKNPQNHNKIERAASFFILSTMCFGSIIGASFSTNKSVPNSPMPLRLTKKKKMFTSHLANRFENAIIECLDAVDLIIRYDSADAFFYIDPPYFQADMGHYGGYTSTDFERLLKTLSTIKGKFLLSCYPSDLIEKYTTENKWKTLKVSAYTSATTTSTNRQRTEVLTYNYDI